MTDGEVDPGRRTLIVVIVGAGLLLGAGAILFAMWVVAEGVRDAASRRSASAGRAGSGAADPADFDAAILAAAEARFEALPEAARVGIADLRNAVEPRMFAHFVDSAVRLEMATRCSTAYFAGDTGAAQTAGTERLRERLAAPDLVATRTRLGRLVGRSLRGERSGRSSPGGGEVIATTTFRAWFERGFAEVETRFVYAGRATWKIDGIGVTPMEPPAGEARPDDGTTVPFPAGEKPVHAGAKKGATEIVRQTCDVCSAVRYGRPGEAWRIAADKPGHTHLWQDGASSGVRDPVADGTIVLLKKAGALAAVTVGAQTEKPERVSFDWAYRDDGGTVLDPADEAVSTGHVDGAKSIDVRGIHVAWSIASDGRGWLYFSRAVGEDARPGDTRLCVTDRSDLAGLDAADPRWVFRASLSDEGERAK